jgi:hypothetical protein
VSSDDNESIGPGWYVIERFHDDPARVVAGPKDRESAESHAHFLMDPNAKIMHTPALVNAIKNDGYNVEWQPDVEKPDALTDGDRGLYEKYEVYKDGDAVPNCFVLEPESDSAAREALIRYAEATDDEELAEDLREWVTDLCTRGEADA